MLHLNFSILAFSTNFCPRIDYPFLRVSWKDDRWNPLGDSNWCKSVGIYCSREREIKFYPLVIFQLDWRTAASEAVRGCRRGWKNFSSIFDSFQEDDGWRPKEKKRKREEDARCLNITEKVAYNISSEACGQTVLPDRSILIRQKLVENAKKWKVQMRHFGWFSNTVEEDEKSPLEKRLVEKLGKYQEVGKTKRILKMVGKSRSSFILFLNGCIAKNFVKEELGNFI